MDIDGLKTDVQTALRRLPKQFLINMGREVMANKEVLAAQIPKIINELAPHFKAAMFEAAMGGLDIEALEKAGMEVLEDFINIDMDDSNSPKPEDHPDDPTLGQ